jgi:hypothetical protein
MVQVKAKEADMDDMKRNSIQRLALAMLKCAAQHVKLTRSEHHDARIALALVCQHGTEEAVRLRLVDYLKSLNSMFAAQETYGHAWDNYTTYAQEGDHE